MLSRVAGALLLLLFTFPVESAAPAKEAIVTGDLGQDHFAVGCPVRIDKPVGGDAFLAGCSVNVDAAVGGDAVVAGGHVRIGAPVRQSLYAAGGQLTVDAAVARNVRIAGGLVEIAPRAEIGGSISAAGGDVRVAGAVKGYVRAAGGKVLIDGAVEGDVVATAETVELGPNARIGGKLRYASREELVRDPAAETRGGVERMESSLSGVTHRETEEHSLVHRGDWIWTLGLLVVAGVLVAALPGFTSRVSATGRAKFGMSLLVGFIALVCVPAAALVFLLTIVGLPLALATAALYFVLLLAGYVSAGIGLGDYALARASAQRAGSVRWRVGAAMLGMLAISLAGRLPLLGALVVFVALVTGIGALALQARRARMPA